MSGFSDLFTGGKPPRRRPGQRGKAKSPREAMNGEMVTYLRKLKRDGDPLYDQIMRQQAEKIFASSQGKPSKGEIAVLAEQFAMMRDAGFIQDPAKIGEKSLMEEIAPLLAAAAAAFVQMRGGGSPPPPPAYLPPPTPPAYYPDPAPQGSVPPAPVEPAPPTHHPNGSEPAPAAPAAQHEEAADMFDRSIALKIYLQTMQPPDAAQAMYGYLDKDQNARRLIETLCATPDSALDGVLYAHRQEGAALVDWLRQNLAWTQETVWHLRQLTGIHPEGELEREPPTPLHRGI